jgi:glycerol-3-phosphate acyltransferase PlsY
MALLVLFVLGYLIGAIPFAWLLVRRREGIDLYATGSTNVGATNAYESTGSRRLGAAVLVLDLLKGVAAVLLGWALGPALADALAGLTADAEAARYWAGAGALLGALAGHTYNAFLSLKAGRLAGGKGFATAAGGFGVLMPWVVPTWLALLYVGVRLFEWRRGIRDPIPGNVLATALVPFVLLPVYGLRGALVLGLFALMTLPRHQRQLGALLAAAHGVHPQTGKRAQVLGRSPAERAVEADASKNR